MNIGEQLLEGQPIVATIITAIFLLLLLMEKDELEQYAFNNALKIATVITIITLFGYSLYELSVGFKKVSINTIFLGIEGLYIITLFLYYMDLKGIRFEVKMKNQLLTNIFMYSSIIISILATISMVFEFEFFENKKGFIRYDELILYVNAILVAMMIPLLPKRKKVNREEYKKIKKEMDKQFNIMCVIYCMSMLLIVSYMIYQKVI
ncbi:hypothetical protein [Crassaminicella profunda]|uniref:hypothetical protein n=1 Tax=Crassaminicella profunda TaxID=1286698 RepID=UPI001CA71374|nr:hypothetical protein [Crassaminicella profunda]QZY57310.1 hypothetical protein K7H06_10475 [Crassaminicella profunda]